MSAKNCHWQKISSFFADFLYKTSPEKCLVLEYYMITIDHVIKNINELIAKP